MLATQCQGQVLAGSEYQCLTEGSATACEDVAPRMEQPILDLIQLGSDTSISIVRLNTDIDNMEAEVQSEITKIQNRLKLVQQGKNGFKCS